MDPSRPYPNTPYPSQTYAQQAYPPSAGGGGQTTTTTVTSSRVVVVQPYFDVNYLRTIPGILKVVQLVLMLIAFILAAAARTSQWYWSYTVNGYDILGYTTGSAGWTKFVTITGFIITLILLFLYLFHLIERFYQVNWMFTEFVYCVVLVVCLFISGAIMIPYANYDGARGACVFFCWAAMVAYAADAYFKFKGWRNGEAAQGIKPSVTMSSTTTAGPPRPPPYPIA